MNWAEEKREHDRARAHVYNRMNGAIRNGVLVRPAVCDDCGAGGVIEAHHDDYSKPLDVRWLCKPCHGHADTLQRERDNPPRATRLRGLRIDAGLTRVELADRAGVPEAVIKRAELGAVPRPASAVKIAAVFNLRASEIWPV